MEVGFLWPGDRSRPAGVPARSAKFRKVKETKLSGNSSKTALVLAGGGLTGAMYEIGALRAINDLILDHSVNDIDIYIGTSAGAIIASSLANGITAEAMMQANAGFHPDIRPILRKDLFNLSQSELLSRLARLPKTVLGAWSHYLRHMDDMSFFDLLWSLLEALPAGFYDGLALERYLRENLLTSYKTNRFDQLEKETLHHRHRPRHVGRGVGPLSGLRPDGRVDRSGRRLAGRMQQPPAVISVLVPNEEGFDRAMAIHELRPAAEDRAVHRGERDRSRRRTPTRRSPRAST
ncbi:MAG: patatin-like phospholipase family protein [Rhodobacteraceae bacterium]|nr:patatin-like phospholipase family protein [Paracoccaceae bacterium]